ncbi:MAG TPA: glycoside hydrolase family 15 protein, partial [Candidatus Saccharimonadales bacterium]|nr:glycoside hydrolase family 15 protein [Candidatus Saccharimonadales bacterium]
MSDQPIGDLALLSDCHSAALVDRSGSVDWWCLPTFSSSSVFGRLLDPAAGHFRVGASGTTLIERHYLEGTLVLQTTHHTPTGTLEVTDALAMVPGVREHDLGAGSPHVLVRHARCLAGEVELEMEFVPRFEYGLTTPMLAAADGGVIATGGPTTLRLTSSVPIEIADNTATAHVILTAGQAAEFAAHGVSTWEPRPAAWRDGTVAERVEDTAEAWRSWSALHQRYHGPYAEAVGLSGRVLQGLTFQPTGAIVAAPTTSLPEVIGGDRNWDYRYAWVRDASFTLGALWIAACPDEVRGFLGFLTTAASSIYSRRSMQIMFGVRGERDLSERTLPWLAGWRDSRPVRVGNAAWTQEQRDIYGEFLDAVHRLRDMLGVIPDPERRFLRTLADRAAAEWQEPDQGIWEIRGEPRHFVHSKLMSWLALERAIDMAADIGGSANVPRWLAARDDIRAAIARDGWNEDVGAFTQTFGSPDLDASTLLISVVGFLPPDDPRVLSTINVIERELSDERGLIRRYRSADGLGGTEGSFLLCSFWFAEAAARSGRLGLARSMFERAVGHANDLGLLSEEVETETGELTGNFPQAFSHVGLVTAAWAIAEAERLA